jgi:xanthine dehydrogenase accessory factor
VNSRALTVVVRGIGDVGSAVAHRLFLEGYAVLIHDVPTPTTTRRGVAFADAVFDGSAILDNVHAVRAHDLPRIKEALASQRAIPVYVRDLGPLLAEMRPEILVDARMRKHEDPEVQLGLAEVTVGLGPSLVAGRHADVVVETSWDLLGTIITAGASVPLAGEPRELGGHARDRYVYAPWDGIFRTKARIGDPVRRGQDIAEIGPVALAVPLD